MLSPMTVSAATSVDAEAVKAAAEAAKAAAEAAEAAAQAAQSAAEAAKTAASKSSSTSYGTYIAGNVDNSVTNNYTYKITVKNSGDKKSTVKVGKSSSGGGVTLLSPVEKPYVHTVTSAPGLDDVIAVGQGGKLVLNGKTTRATFVMRETTSGTVSSAKVLAAQVGGTVKNVVETYAPGVRFSKCQVDFKVYGCKSGDSYKVYQMGANGTWQEVQVDDIHDGHIVCTVYKTGTFAFVKMN